MWTVFDHPRDYPDGYIARCFETGGEPDPVPTNFTVMGELALIRATLEQCGLVCMARSPQAGSVTRWRTRTEISAPKTITPA